MEGDMTEYLVNVHEKFDDNFKPIWKKCSIVERNRSNTGFVVEDYDKQSGLHNRIDEDLR